MPEFAPPKRPKVKTMALFCRDHHGTRQILGTYGEDHTKGIKFYRLIGGHVEMGETTRAALAREIMEELRVEAEINALLGWSENIFTYNGTPGHEVIALYDVKIKNPSDIHDNYTIIDTDHTTGAPVTSHASWVDVDDVKAGRVIIYPIAAAKYL